MTARFRVSGTFTLASRGNFVVVGDIVEGRVCPGMRFPLPAGAPAGSSGHIVGVESLDNIGERSFKVALRIEYTSEQELSYWQSLPLKGATVDLWEHDDFPALGHLLRAYFHQDWPEEYGTYAAALRDFVSRESSVSAVVDEIGVLLSLPDEVFLPRVSAMDCSFDPGSMNTTWRAWLTTVAEALRLGART